MTETDGPEFDTNLLHESRASLREEMLLEPPWTEVILVRHAQQSFSDADLAAGGASGPCLSETGARQADLTGKHLAQEPLAALYSSHLTRASSTASALSRYSSESLTVEIRPELREIEAGGGAREDSLAVRERLTTELTEIAAAHPGQSVAVVGHGGAISTFLASILGIQQDIFFFATHASVTRVRFREGRWAVQTVNECTHLRDHDLVTH